MAKMSLVWHNILPLLLAPLLVLVALAHKNLLKVKDWIVYFSPEHFSLFVILLIVIFDTI